MKHWWIPTVREAFWILALMPVGGLIAAMLWTASSSEIALRDENGQWLVHAYWLLTITVSGMLGVPFLWLAQSNARRNTKS